MKIESHPHVREYVQHTVAEELSSEHSRSALQAMYKTYKIVLSDLVITGTAIENARLKPIYELIETVLINMTEKEALEKLFDCSIDRSAQTTSFKVPFTSQTLAWLQFTRSVTHLVKARMEETAEEWCLLAKAQRFPSAEIGSWRLQLPHSSSSSFEGNYKKYCQDLRRAISWTARDHKGKSKLKDWQSTASSERDTHTTTFGCDSLIQDLSSRTRDEVFPNRLTLATKSDLLVLQKFDRHLSSAVSTEGITLKIASLFITKDCRATILRWWRR